MNKRYQMILTPCEATSRGSWHKPIAEGDSILALWDTAGWRSNLSYDQQFIIQDVKTGKTLTEQEYHALVNRLKGW